MKKLVDILEGIAILNSLDSGQLMISDIGVDSRKLKKGSLFVAYKGYAQDGHNFIESAIQNGAIAIVLDNPDFITSGRDVVYVLVADAKKLSAQIAANFFDHPSTKMKVTGVTGTNGKTSIASLLHSLFEKMGLSSGLISTIDIRIGPDRQASNLTTPDPIALQRTFYEMHRQNISHVFMEVSSHALVQGRTDSVDFDLAIFSNLSHDHLDFHKTFSEYIKAKKILFDTLKKDASALVNLDDPNGRVMVQNCEAKIFTYALHKAADFKAKILSNDLSGLQLIINRVELYLKLIGKFNAYNALAVYGAAIILKQDQHEILRHLSALESAEGRMYVVENQAKGYKAVVDYAHTPDALEKVLKTLKDLVSVESKLITVVGCGGNRDKTKRPIMAKMTVRYSDVSIFTSDNPRDEDPDEIIKDMLTGLNKMHHSVVIRNSDREEAIKTACAMAQKGDIILVAGKGHEKYQEIKGQRFPFDDTKILNAVMH